MNEKTEKLLARCDGDDEEGLLLVWWRADKKNRPLLYTYPAAWLHLEMNLFSGRV